LSKGAVKGSKEVDKARNSTQTYIELLGQHSGAFSTGGKVEPANDPYILQRGIKVRRLRRYPTFISCLGSRPGPRNLYCEGTREPFFVALNLRL